VGCDILKMIINLATQKLHIKFPALWEALSFCHVECFCVICFGNASVMLLKVTANIIAVIKLIVNNYYYL
jgi:hypothetical protein